LNAFLDELRRAKQAVLAIASCTIVAAAASAPPPQVEPFDADTWTKLQKDLPRPAAVVFTATYCTNCPAVLAQLEGELKKRGATGEIVAVVIDEADAATLAENPHYAHATRLFVFDGNEAQLRYRVDPRWRGVTPYVALLSPDATTRFVAGPPKEQDLQQWLRERIEN
jgi:thiol-disulfide isomerase/thioredoxin